MEGWRAGEEEEPQLDKAEEEKPVHRNAGQLFHIKTTNLPNIPYLPPCELSEFENGQSLATEVLSPGKTQGGCPAHTKGPQAIPRGLRHSMGPPGLSPASQDVVLQPRGLDRVKQP